MTGNGRADLALIAVVDVLVSAWSTDDRPLRRKSIIDRVIRLRTDMTEEGVVAALNRLRRMGQVSLFNDTRGPLVAIGRNWIET